MKYFIVFFSADYADEFDIQGFRVEKAESKKSILDSLVHPKTKFPYERYFGTNEAIEYNDKKDFLSNFDIKEIKEEEYKVISKVICNEYCEFQTLEDY